ncbi:Uncharacterised protein [uncultured archaeon]|nr:Uncharacterised protein [uncultured archaeon]
MEQKTISQEYAQSIRRWVKGSSAVSLGTYTLEFMGLMLAIDAYTTRSGKEFLVAFGTYALGRALSTKINNIRQEKTSELENSVIKP